MLTSFLTPQQQHPWLREDKEKDVDMEGWIAKALAYREKNPRISAPALA